MYQIIAISPKHSPELSLYLRIERDAVGVGAISVAIAATSSSIMQIRFRVAAGAIVVVLIFALAHSRPRVHPEIGRLNSGWPRDDLPCWNA